MTIETKRLRLIPFTLEIIKAAMTNDQILYKKLGIISNEEWPELDLQEALSYFIDEINKNGVTGFGSWLILNKKNEIVGSAGFIGEPQCGVVEIGFGIIPGQRKKGLCTEAVMALIKWGNEQGKVTKVIASCDNDNEASKRVLENLNFVIISDEANLLKWEFALNSNKILPGKTDRIETS